MKKLRFVLTLIAVVAVIIGLLAKLNHWNNAPIYIVIGFVAMILLIVRFVACILQLVKNAK